MINKLKNILISNKKEFFLFFWIFLVLYFWFKNHINGLFKALWIHYPSSFQLIPLLVAVLITGSLVLYIIFIKKTSKIKIEISSLEISIFFILFCYFPFSFLIFKVSPYTAEFTIPLNNLSSAYISFSQKLFFYLLWIFVFLLSSFLLGKLVKNIFLKNKINNNLLLSILTEISFGFFGWSVIIFILGLFGSINTTSVSFLLALVFLINFKNLKEVLKKSFKRFSIVIDFKKMWIWIWTLLILLTSLNLIDSMRPVPTGYDDTAAYLNHPNIMASTGSLIFKKFPFPFELLESFGQIFSKNSSFAIAPSFLFSILGTLAIYGFSSYIFNKKIGFLSAIFWYSMPFISQVVYQQIKPDLLLFFITTIGIWFFFIWFKEKNNKNLYLSAFLIGFSCTIKLTGFFLLPAMGLIYLFQLKKIRGTLKRKIRISLIAILLFIIPFLHWGSFSLISKNPQQANFDMEKFNGEVNINYESWKNNLENEELLRYRSENISQNIFFLWDATMNNRTNHISVEIGFFFLIMLIIFALWAKDFYKNSLYFQKEISIFLVLYWLTWLILGRQILWYGYLGFLFFILLFSNVFIQKSISQKIKHVSFIILILSFVINITMRTWMFGDERLAKYLSSVSKAESIYYPQTRSLLEDINKNSQEKIIVSSGNFLYFINNNERVLNDPVLNKFSFLNQEKKSNLTIKRLDSLGIKYILIDYSMINMEKNPEGSLHKKFMEFQKFSNEKLLIEKNFNNIYLYKILK